MKVTNSTAYVLIAFGWHAQRGYGDDVSIPAGETVEVSGPYLGEMGGGKCYVAIPGQIVCQETTDDNLGFQVASGYPLNIASGDTGICVRHCDNEPEPQVTDWREERKVFESSYCLDIRLGRNEQQREELIDCLKKTGAPFGVTKAQRGMWQGVKLLRVETPKATELAQHLNHFLRTGDDYDYEIHQSFTDANRSDAWLPDLDTEHGYKRFDLVQTEGAAS